MPIIIEMPKLSDTMTTGTVVKWLKNEGDPIKSGDVLAHIETDKATMDLESFDTGTLLKIVAPAGTVLPCNAPVAVIGEPGEKIDETLLTAPAPSIEAPVESAPAPQTPAAATAPIAAQAPGCFESPRAHPRRSPQPD